MIKEQIKLYLNWLKNKKIKHNYKNLSDFLVLERERLEQLSMK